MKTKVQHACWLTRCAIKDIVTFLLFVIIIIIYFTASFYEGCNVE